MSLVLTGNAANVRTGLSATVTGLANNGGGLIRVATSAAHLFGQNDLVLMNAAPAVGAFNINVIDSTHFDLQGSTFTTTGTGTAIDQNITPQIQVPTDGDTFSLQLSGMLSALQGILDRTQLLALGKGAYKLANMQTVIGSDPTLGSIAAWTISGTGAGTANGAFSSTKIMTVQNLLTTDLLEINVDDGLVEGQNGSGAVSAIVGLGFVGYAPGATPGAPTRLNGSAKRNAQGPTLVLTGSGFGLHGMLGVSQAIPVNGNVDVYFFAYTDTSSPGSWSITIDQEYTATAKVWR